jgi:hypothetical protein
MQQMERPVRWGTSGLNRWEVGHIIGEWWIVFMFFAHDIIIREKEQEVESKT